MPTNQTDIRVHTEVIFQQPVVDLVKIFQHPVADLALEDAQQVVHVVLQALPATS